MVNVWLKSSASTHTNENFPNMFTAYPKIGVLIKSYPFTIKNTPKRIFVMDMYFAQAYFKTLYPDKKVSKTNGQWAIVIN